MPKITGVGIIAKIVVKQGRLPTPADKLVDIQSLIQSEMSFNKLGTAR